MAQTIHGASNRNAGTGVPSGDRTQINQTNGTDRAKQKAGDAVESAKQQATQTQEEVKQQAAEVASAAKQKAYEATAAAKESGRKYAHEKKTRLADELGIFSGAIRKASSKLHEEQHDSLASYIDAAAEQLDHVRESLQSKEVGDLMSDVQDFTRRRPEVVYGGLFVAGLAAMRFLKASKPERQRQINAADLERHRNRPLAAFDRDSLRTNAGRSTSGTLARDDSDPNSLGGTQS
ncbi:hypothetical protein RMSM_05588 [Rhodopirellula maiorica SM1]|uniref:Uncharacterized protein n=1 Tax=Rhodopirellula maiorica SM1 TaxID=1265738 RepID=M5RDN5_9BACT|nr:hypothetical protein [Rhodopirellula maiorica]EMI17495.1 hypothetical protein RMSM_05588 [Rhodopirellula maiorica SM1]